VKLDLLEEEELLKKRNRIRKLAPKKHKVAHESGRSTKTLWAKIVQKSKSK
jgi:hypothetical protein